MSFILLLSLPCLHAYRIIASPMTTRDLLHSTYHISDVWKFLERYHRCNLYRWEREQYRAGIQSQLLESCA